MRKNTIKRVAATIYFALILAWTMMPVTAQAQGAGGTAGGGTGGATPGGRGGASSGSGSGGSGVPRGKNLDGTLKVPVMPGVSPQQRDRAQRLEEKLRQGETSTTTPQTQMSDRLEQLHQHSSPGPGPSGTDTTGQ